MTISNPPIPNVLQTVSGEFVKCIITDLPTWNMQIVPEISVPTEIPSPSNLLNGCIIGGFVQSDAFPSLYLTIGGVFGEGLPATIVDVAVQQILGNTITLERNANGRCNRPDFTNTFVSRGKLMIWYVDLI